MKNQMAASSVIVLAVLTAPNPPPPPFDSSVGIGSFGDIVLTPPTVLTLTPGG